MEKQVNPGQNLSPRELSEAAIATAENNPSLWSQNHWHCGTSHCWAGLIDLMLGGNCPVNLVSDLVKDVQGVLGLTDDQWSLITDPCNTLARIKAFHKEFFVDGEFGIDGLDSNGVDRDGYGLDGFDCHGFDRDGYGPDGFNSYGLDRDGFDLYGHKRPVD